MSQESRGPGGQLSWWREVSSPHGSELGESWPPRAALAGDPATLSRVIELGEW